MIGYKLKKLNMCKHNFYNNMALNLFGVNLRIFNSLVFYLLDHKLTSVNHSFSQISHSFRNIYIENKIVYLEEGKSRKQNLKVDDAFYTLQKKDTQELTMLARLCNQLDLKSPVPIIYQMLQSKHR